MDVGDKSGSRGGATDDAHVHSQMAEEGEMEGVRSRPTPPARPTPQHLRHQPFTPAPASANRPSAPPVPGPSPASSLGSRGEPGPDLHARDPELDVDLHSREDPGPELHTRESTEWGSARGTQGLRCSLPPPPPLVSGSGNRGNGGPLAPRSSSVSFVNAAETPRGGSGGSAGGSMVGKSEVLGGCYYGGGVWGAASGLRARAEGLSRLGTPTLTDINPVGRLGLHELPGHSLEI